MAQGFYACGFGIYDSYPWDNPGAQLYGGSVGIRHKYNP